MVDAQANPRFPAAHAERGYIQSGAVSASEVFIAPYAEQ